MEKTPKDLSEVDKGIISRLVKDGRMSAGEIARQLRITPPTVRSRLEAMIKSGLLRISGLIDASRAEFLTMAIVGINLELHEELDRKIEQISNLEQVHWAVVVTGKYDIIVEIGTTEGIQGIYRFLIEELPKVGGIRSTESFAVMKARNKWLLLRKGMK
jgi:Lrp/AsnC family transcriptional regulator for asnA, asnC and gidA